MSQIPFKVSARTARLIGRENVANSEGAIIELVKNTYDADARTCIVYFDNKYNSTPKKLSKLEYNHFMKDHSQIIEETYELKGEEYCLKEIGKEVLDSLNHIFSKENSIYIIDNGEGMTREVIEKCWMTIGTDNKRENFKTENGRIKTGAKGIGRFALDRLGNKCEMITYSKKTNKSHKWSVNWNDFGKTGTSIDEVTANLDKIENSILYQEIESLLDNLGQAEDILNQKLYPNGTLIKISDLRDDWSDYYVNKIYTNLEMLIPPKEEMDKDNNFDIYVFSSLKKNKYGKIESSVGDDFDYKLHANIKEDGKVEIEIYRDEFNVSLIPKEIFNYKKMQQFPFDLETFRKGYFKIECSLEELLPGYKEYEGNIIDEIGSFEFKLYFMKKSYVRKKKKIYFYKNFNSSFRNKWLDQFGGIKLFRDNFRVRPYGEASGSSFDWLMLGDRVSKSPAAASHLRGSWRVRPNQIYGIISISRLNNINFEDKSSREGLQETKEFNIFKELIINIIREFERDRQTIMRIMKKYYEDNNKRESNKKKAKSIAKKIVSNTKKDKNLNQIIESKKEKSIKQEEQILAQSFLASEQEAQELLDELKLLRGLSTTGLVITSFAHEFKNLSARILPRTYELRNILKNLIDSKTLSNLKEYENPFIMIDDFETQDKKLKFWLDFALNVVKKDKRKRKKFDLYTVFKEFKRNWESALSSQAVQLNVPEPIDGEKCLKKVFLIDIDSIFNNLITNSLDAFIKRSDATNRREININMEEKNNKLYILYEDTGPGLSKNIGNPYKIFEPFFTTKRNKVGEKIGTGIGMWIVESTVEEYKGEIEILTPDESGFQIKIILPLNKYEGVIKK
ncbi:sensor histidine kinase [Orenia marismortui]|uniref:sensor histidine kinase n=1 Tax=Orenia marismortui TaxID=46469 RepID=UPI00036B2AF0|nr:sensor histidine kinase [Orenia marismortui]